MKNRQHNIERFNRSIQEKLENDIWSDNIACQIIQIRKDRQKKWVQISAFPVLLVVSAVIFYAQSGKNNNEDMLSEKESQVIENLAENENIVLPQHNHSNDFFNSKFNYNVHLMNTVFSNEP